MQDKTASIAKEFVYKVVTRKGYLVRSSAVMGGLKQCVALFNEEHQPATAISYDKAFRKVRTQGVHVEFAKCTWAVGGGEKLPLVVIFSSAEPEVLPQQPATLFDEIEASNAGFQKGMSMAELGAVAQAINAKVADVQLTEAQAEKLMSKALGEFGRVWAEEVAATIARVQKEYTGESDIDKALRHADEFIALADRVIADVDNSEIAKTQTAGTIDELPF